jgi:hypothetical protein
MKSSSSSEFLVDDLGEKSSFHPLDLEALVDKEVMKAFIPSPRCLLEPIERLVQPINMIRKYLGSSNPRGCSTNTNSLMKPFKNALFTSI